MLHALEEVYLPDVGVVQGRVDLVEHEEGSRVVAEHEISSLSLVYECCAADPEKTGSGPLRCKTSPKILRSAV